MLCYGYGALGMFVADVDGIKVTTRATYWVWETKSGVHATCGIATGLRLLLRSSRGL